MEQDYLEDDDLEDDYNDEDYNNIEDFDLNDEKVFLDEDKIIIIFNDGTWKSKKCAGQQQAKDLYLSWKQSN